jgi:hypothetical protein
MTRAESFGGGPCGSESLLDDLGALLGVLVQSPVAAAITALLVVLFVGTALIGRTGAPSVVVTRGTLAPSAAARATSSPTVSKQTEHVVKASHANLRPAMQSRTLTSEKHPRVLDLRHLGGRSNASLGRGPPGRGHR